MPLVNFRFLKGEVLSFHAAAMIMAGGSLAAKLLGLLRDRLLAGHFGAGDTLDVYYAAFQIPDLLYTLLLVGAASAAVLPVFIAYDQKNPRRAERFAGNLLMVFSASALVLVLVAIVLAPWLVALAAPGFSGVKLAIAVGLTRRMLGGVIFLGISGIFSSILQARHRFWAFALAPMAYNLGIIGGIVFLVPRLGATGLAYGVVAGTMLQAGLGLVALLAVGFRFRPSWVDRGLGLGRVFRTSAPRVLALGMSQLTILALTAIASFFPSGSVAVFKLAANLMYVPVSLIGVSYALAVFPKLSRASIAQEGQAFGEHVHLGMRNIFFWTAPVAAMAIVLRAHLVRVILGSGAFNWEDTRLVAASLAILAIAIVSESLLPLVLRAFYALGDTKSPLVWDIAGSLATIGCAMAFSWWFLHSPAILLVLARLLRIGDLASPLILAVPLGFVLGSLVNCLLLVLALEAASVRRLGVRLHASIEEYAAVAGAACLAGLGAYATLLPFPAIVPTNTFIGIFVQGLAAGLVGFLIYGLALWLGGNQDIRAIAGTLRGRALSPAETPAVFEAEKFDGKGGT